MKTCSRCKQEVPRSEFNKDSRYKDGYFSWCRPCMAAYRQERKNDPSVVAQTKKRMANYYIENKERINKYNNEWCLQKYHADDDYRKRKELQKLESIERLKNDPAYIKRRRRWVRDNSRRRRAILFNSPGSFTDAEFADICRKYGGKCLKCGKQKKLSADHIVPVSRGGNNLISNIQPLCMPCNTSKGAKTVDYRPYYSME